MYMEIFFQLLPCLLFNGCGHCSQQYNSKTSWEMPNQGWWSGELRKKDGQRAGSKNHRRQSRQGGQARSIRGPKDFWQREEETSRLARNKHTLDQNKRDNTGFLRKIKLYQFTHRLKHILPPKAVNQGDPELVGMLVSFVQNCSGILGDKSSQLLA